VSIFYKYGHAALTDGSGLNGCYASHIVLRPGTQIMTVPEALPDAIAAPANCALATIVNALETLPRSPAAALWCKAAACLASMPAHG